MAMIFGDYVAGFLGLARDGSGWSMDPFEVRFLSVVHVTNHSSDSRVQPIKMDNGEYLGRGEGNHVSVEFNLLYRVRGFSFENALIFDTLSSVACGHSTERYQMDRRSLH
jgi:hypothetical protein